MKRLILLIVLLFFPVCARADAAQELIDSLDLSQWQAAAEEAGAELDVMQMLRALVSGETEFTPQALFDLLREMILGEAQSMRGQLLVFLGPALLWAVNRQLAGEDGSSGAAGLICFVFGASAMLSAFASHMEMARAAIRRAFADVPDAEAEERMHSGEERLRPSQLIHLRVPELSRGAYIAANVAFAAKMRACLAKGFPSASSGTLLKLVAMVDWKSAAA